jgi:hypothetical protein
VSGSLASQGFVGYLATVNKQMGCWIFWKEENLLPIVKNKIPCPAGLGRCQLFSEHGPLSSRSNASCQLTEMRMPGPHPTSVELETRGEALQTCFNVPSRVGFKLKCTFSWNRLRYLALFPSSFTSLPCYPLPSFLPTNQTPSVMG